MKSKIITQICIQVIYLLLICVLHLVMSIWKGLPLPKQIHFIQQPCLMLTGKKLTFPIRCLIKSIRQVQPSLWLLWLLWKTLICQTLSQCLRMPIWTALLLTKQLAEYRLAIRLHYPIYYMVCYFIPEMTMQQQLQNMWAEVWMDLPKWWIKKRKS